MKYLSSSCWFSFLYTLTEKLDRISLDLVQGMNLLLGGMMRFVLILFLLLTVFISCKKKKDDYQPTLKVNIQDDGSLKIGDKTFSQNTSSNIKDIQAFLKDIGFPIYDGLKLDNAVLRKRENLVTFNLCGHTKDSPDKVRDFYKKSLGSAIKEAYTESTDTGGAICLSGEGDIYLFKIRIIEDRNQTVVFVSGKK